MAVDQALTVLEIVGVLLGLIFVILSLLLRSASRGDLHIPETDALGYILGAMLFLLVAGVISGNHLIQEGPDGVRAAAFAVVVALLLMGAATVDAVVEIRDSVAQTTADTDSGESASESSGE